MLESLYLNLGQHDALSEEEKALLAGAMSLERYVAAGEQRLFFLRLGIVLAKVEIERFQHPGSSIRNS